MRTLFPVLGVAIVVVLIVALTGGGEPEPKINLTTAGILADAVENATATARLNGDVAIPLAATAPAAPTTKPSPCPYCNQDPDRWRALTSVAPPELLGTSAVLMEASCGEMILGLQWREHRQPASLAKIATAMVVAEHARLSDMVEIQITGWDLAVENDSSIMGLIAGMQISVEELLYGLLLSSGNDAALELSRHLGGEVKVVGMMNERVAELGLTDTRLMNSHGLDEAGAYSTPFDMAVMGRELLNNPLLKSVVVTQFREEKWHDLGGLWNGNYLLYIYEDAIGIKTGYTEGAGWSIVSAAERDGRTLIASVFNSSDVYWDSMRLFDWAYENTTTACR